MSASQSNDQIHRFIFDDCDIRGEIVSLRQSFADATEHQVLPLPAKILLGEFLAASCLLIEVLKFSGTLTLQARGAGAIPLIMAEANGDRSLRGIVKISSEVDVAALEHGTFEELIGAGVLTLTLDPDQGKRYQGIVALQGQNLAECLSNYFAQSEQLPTRLWLFADAHHASGLLLQALPAQHGDTHHADAWHTAETLSNTLTREEIHNLDHATVLSRLYHEFQVRLFEPQNLKFACHCSKERSANALTSLGKADAEALLEEQEVITMDCDFCGVTYHFDKNDITELFGPNQPHLH